MFNNEQNQRKIKQKTRRKKKNILLYVLMSSTHPFFWAEKLLQPSSFQETCNKIEFVPSAPRILKRGGHYTHCLWEERKVICPQSRVKKKMSQKVRGQKHTPRQKSEMTEPWYKTMRPSMGELNKGSWLFGLESSNQES